MPTAPSSPASVQLGITLSAISYLGRFETDSERLKTMNAAMAATAPGWSIVWGPATKGEDLMYVASNGSGQYAVVVRGTVFTLIEDVIQDLRISQHPLPFSSSSFEGAKISKGAIEVWTNLTNMQGMVASGGTQSLIDFLGSLSSPAILVTGHSLGGQSATVLAAWLSSQSSLSGATIQPITFAAPTAGDKTFADCFDKVFQSSGTTRYINAIDVIPDLWTEKGLETIETLYQSVGGPACGSLCKAAVSTAQKKLKEHHARYVQPEPHQSLPGQVYSTGLLGKFEDEANDQHRALYYMYLLGIPQATINQIDSKWAPPSASSSSQSAAGPSAG